MTAPHIANTSPPVLEVELVGRAVTGQLRGWFLIPHRCRIKGFPCQLCFSAFGIVIDHSLVHHASFLVILQPGVGLSDLQGSGGKFRTEGIVGDNVVEGFQRFLLAP